jgi:bacillithiol biosynthesis deacetylase BshB1
MKLDMMAFGAHPDDVEIFAGGTLAKMAALGHAVGIVDMTRGEFGSRGTAAGRRREAQAAAAILGVKIRETVGLRDGAIQVAPQARLKIIRLLRKYRPIVVVTHYWEDRHPDHVNTCRLVSEAVHHSGLEKVKTGQKRYRPQTVLHFKLPHHVTPTFVVDVTDYAERRNEAINAHRSQMFNLAGEEPSTYLSQPDFSGHIDNIHSYYGALIGARKGEAFFTQGVLEIEDPVEHFSNPPPYRFR